jgi:hypothetical protein
MKKVLLTALVLCCALTLAGGAGLAGTVQPAIRRWVMAGGGGQLDSAVTRLVGTMGQAVVGCASSPGLCLTSGFWSPVAGAIHVVAVVQLPMVVK